MSGILANSSSHTMTSGDSSANNAVSGYITRERVVLTTSPAGSNYAWGLAVPQGATPLRTVLSDDTAANPTFLPEVAGEYLATCTVDGSAFYVLRISVTRTGVGTVQEVLRLQPKTDASVPAPSSGRSLYYSSTQGKLCVKLPDGSIEFVNTTTV